MTNTWALEQVGELGNIRERLGAKDRYDTSQDERINRMDARSLVREWAGWHIGDPSWADGVLNLYKKLENAKEQEDHRSENGKKA